MKVLKRIEEINSIIEEYKNHFSVEKIPFNESKDWFFENGTLVHKSKGFFSVVGVEDIDHNQKVLLYQPQHALTGLLTRIIDGERCYLIQARAEPGNINGVQFGPTIQSTPANYLMFHGGKSTPFVDFFIYKNTDINIISETTQLDFGERYLYKCKRSIIIESTEQIESFDNFVWINHRLCLKLIEIDNLFNLDLKSIISIMPWETDFTLSKNKYFYKHFSIRQEQVGKIISHFQNDIKSNKTIELENLKNWEFDNVSLKEINPIQNFTIDMFKVFTKGREVDFWTQPLINSKTNGKVILVIKSVENNIQILVNVKQESGLSSNYALFPTVFYYPGAASVDSIYLLKKNVKSDYFNLKSSVLNSDEGGRFFQDISKYEIYEASENAVSNIENTYWLNISEMKLFLAMSNIVSIQLRAILSQLLVV